MDEWMDRWRVNIKVYGCLAEIVDGWINWQAYGWVSG